METDARPKKRFLVSRRFRRLRRKALLSQSELGRLIGLCAESICRIERRHRLPRLQSWRRFAELEARQNQPAVRWPKHWR